MCDLTKEFKLCTCNGDKLSADEIGWILRRKDANKPISLIMGKPFIYSLSSKEQGIKTAIAQLLNAKNCFDFEYHPQEDDFLKIRMQKNKTEWFAFRFLDGCWKEDNSTSFEDWRKQLEPLEDGKIVQL